MSFTRKIAKKRSSDLVEEANKVFNSVYPTRIENISCNAAVEKQECFDNWDYKDKDDKDKLVCNFASAFKTINNIINGNILSCFEDTIFDRLKNNASTNIEKSKFIYQLLNSVNIYFVKSEMCGGKTFDEKDIPSDTVSSIVLEKGDLHSSISNEDFEKANKRENIDKAVCLGTYRRDEKRYFAGEGANNVNGSAISSFGDVSEHCSIFLWVDHIYESSDNKGISFEALLTFVLLHELMHLMMDVFDETNFGIKGEGNLKDLGQLYGYFREESLANALALYLCNATGKESLVYPILDYFVQSQTIPYQIGTLYTKKGILKKAVNNWMACKKGIFLTKQLAKEWLLEVTTESPSQSVLTRIEDAIEITTQ